MYRHKRSRRGASTIVLILMLAFFVVLPLAIFGFEVSRYLLIVAQLRSVTDAAALSGTAALASAPPGTEAQRQKIAMDAAEVTFRQNSIMRTQFTPATLTANQNPMPPVPQVPGLYKAALNIVLLNQNGTQVPTGTPASTMQIQSWYSDAPLFTSKLVPLGTIYTASTISNGGLPQIDVILCFDVSGSMDDQTSVYLVRKEGTGMPTYTPVQGPNTIYDMFIPPPTGTGLNVYPPMNCSYASYSDGGVKSNTKAWTFSESPSPYAGANGLRTKVGSPAGPPAMPEQGMPPGNVVPAGAFTDMVVNVPSTIGSYSFPNLATVVEASRGNMESSTALAAACNGAANIPPSLPAPKAGYYDAYWNYVLNNAQPISSARAAAYNFYNIMNLSANSHFGFVAFSDGIGTGPSSTWSGTNRRVDGAYAAGGTGSFPMPYVALDLANSAYSNCVTAINGNATSTPNGSALVATGQTNITAALTQAYNDIKSTSPLTRKGAKRAIVLFTDGVPNLPTSEAIGASSALTLAGTAGSDGVPIYTIGLSQVNAIKLKEDNLLGDGKNGSGNGIAKVSGNGAIYIAVTNSSDLEQAFQTIARSLCVIQ